MRFTKSLLALLVVLASVSLSATPISIGQISSISYLPQAGNQTVQVFNSTGMCDGVNFLVCDNLNISDWTLVVELNTGTQTFTAMGSWDDIGPGSYSGQLSSPWEFDQSCTSGMCPPFDTTITHVTFSGSIGPSGGPVLLNVGSPGSTTTFFANNKFSVDYTPTLDANGYVTNWADILVDPYSGTGNITVPEPSGLVLSVLGLGAVAAKLSRRRATR